MVQQVYFNLKNHHAENQSVNLVAQSPFLGPTAAAAAQELVTDIVS